MVSADGRFLRAVGQERAPAWDATHFNEPTDVAMAGDGSFYVSDGYQNARVAHFRPPRGPIAQAELHRTLA